MANRWGNDEDSDRLLFFFCSKITVDGDCSLEIKGRLLLETKAMTNLDSILKSRNITLPTKSLYQSYGFSNSHVWMVRAGQQKRLSAEELMPSNCGVEEDS